LAFTTACTAVQAVMRSGADTHVLFRVKFHVDRCIMIAPSFTDQGQTARRTNPMPNLTLIGESHHPAGEPKKLRCGASK